MTEPTTAPGVDLAEIVREIQNGREDLFLTLWERVRRFAARYANAWSRRSKELAGEGCSGDEYEDLMQSAFIALYDAVPRYDPTRGSFLTLYKWFLKRAFRRYSGRPLNGSAKDPAFTAQSLDKPANAEDEDGELVIDTIPETSASAGDTAKQRIFDNGLRDRVAALLARLPDDASNRLRRVYYDGDPVAQIAKDAGLTEKQLRSRLDADRKRVRHALRRTPEGLAIRKYIEGATDYYLHYPARSQARPVEDLVLRRDLMEAKSMGYYCDELQIFDRLRDETERAWTPERGTGRQRHIETIRLFELTASTAAGS